MTKTEFKEQFKRLRVAGYRLPVSDGVTVDDVMDEWFKTFQGCTSRELSEAIDRLKKEKTDTFWPATGQLWFHIKDVRKGDAIRRQASEHTGEWAMSEEDTQEFLSILRAARDRIVRKMPNAEAQVRPQHIEDAEALAIEDSEASA